MEAEELKEIFKNNVEIVKHYGVKNQIPIWIEEMSELTKVLCKWFRLYESLDGDIPLQLLVDMEEEITDVTVCLDQIKYAINFIEDDLMKNYKYKVDRQHNRMEEERNGRN